MELQSRYEIVSQYAGGYAWWQWLALALIAAVVVGV